MAIISANRFSKMNGNFIIAANESYGVEDMGRILIENERNDQAIFTAALKSDLHEIQCRTEGTLLESELQAFSEGAMKDFFDSIIAKLKKFWAKIKGVFKRAYAMVTAYVVRNGRAFISANRKELDKLTKASKVKGKAFAKKSDAPVFDYTKATFAKVKSMEGQEKTDVVKGMLSAVCGKKFDEDSNFYKWVKENSFEELPEDSTIGAYCSGGPSELMATLSKGTSIVKSLKEAERKADKDIQNSIKEVLNAKKKVDDKDKDEETKKSVKFYEMASSAVTNALSTALSAQIKLLKFELAQARIILARAIAKNNVVESALFESQIQQIMEDAAEMEDDTPAPGEDPEVDAATEKVVQAVEELIDTAADDVAEEEGEE